MNKNKNIFDLRNCLSKEELIGYAKQSLSEKEKHQVEKHLLDCELCTEALEGILFLDNPAKLHSISSDMIRRLREENPVVKKNRMRPVYLVAAAVACLFIISGIYFAVIRNPENYKTEVADLPLKKEEIKPVPAPLVDNSLEKTSDSVDKTPVSKNKTESKTELKQTSRNESVQTIVAAPATGMSEKDMGVSAQPRSSMENNGAIAADEIAKAEAPVIADKKAMPVPASAKMSELKTITNDSIRTATSKNYSTAENVSESAMVRRNEKSNLHQAQQTNIDDDIKDVQKKIEYENYKDALKELKQLSNEHPGDMNVVYYTGLVYYKTNETTKALICFDQVLNSSDKKNFEDARLHKALTYVKMDDKQNARKILSHIISEKGIYKERAEGILEQMDGN